MEKTTEISQPPKTPKFDPRRKYFLAAREKAVSVFNPPKKQPAADEERLALMGR